MGFDHSSDLLGMDFIYVLLLLCGIFTNYFAESYLSHPSVHRLLMSRLLQELIGKTLMFTECVVLCFKIGIRAYVIAQ